ncbi:C-GCAxxG-C-C family protein [Desulfovibrio piger]|uniref:C-GCAxxG-C-C family protein n=1 Tax=Desulfovibrio piger TaxID=901 RepID=UPI0026ECD3E0|nr:C-GCAxxG-C-C family protein [Desulfovibrio piger]
MDHQEIARQFAACIACSQQICRHFAPRLGIDDSLALRMAAAFGSGMGHAGTCGCFTGAMLVLGLRFGPHESATACACTERLAGEIRRFEGLFRQAHGSLLCRDILGIDISSPEGLARACAQGLFSSVCAPLVARTCALLECGWEGPREEGSPETPGPGAADAPCPQRP